MSADEDLGSYNGGNTVLDDLPTNIRLDLQYHLTVIDQEEATVRITRDDPIEALYFPIDAIYSVIVQLSNGDAYEVGLIGRDGLICAEVVLGAHSAARTIICQEGGRVARLAQAEAVSLMVVHREIRAALQTAVRRQWFVSQQTVACNYAHSLQQRAARWILMTQEAVGQTTFGMRAEFASMMLGVSQRAVLSTFNELQDGGSIRYVAERVTIMSRDALKKMVCECYERQKFVASMD